MKSLEVRVAEGYAALKARSSVEVNRVLSEVAGKTVEQQLAAVEAACKEAGLKQGKDLVWESAGRTPKFLGANWRAVSESDLLQFGDLSEVEQTAKDFRMSLREAAIFCGLPDPGKDAKLSAELQETLTEKWFGMKGLLSEAEIKTLVAKGIQP